MLPAFYALFSPAFRGSCPDFRIFAIAAVAVDLVVLALVVIGAYRVLSLVPGSRQGRLWMGAGYAFGVLVLAVWNAGGLRGLAPQCT